MLLPMQPETNPAPTTTPGSFAGLLAALTAPKTDTGLPPGDRSSSPGWKSPLDWDDDGLADDVATLSYENALRARARYRALDRTDRSLTGPDPNPVDSYELAPLEDVPAPLPAQAFAASQPVPAPQPAAQPPAAPRVPAAFERNLKSASVTIRMSQEEAAQLHLRAAEAGLTVSAYLRSCTFEAESLRALVKDTMAQLRASTAAGKLPAPRRSVSAWFVRLFTPWRAGRMARA